MRREPPHPEPSRTPRRRPPSSRSTAKPPARARRRRADRERHRGRAPSRTTGRSPSLPTAARAVHEVNPTVWATYAPIAGSPDFLRAVMDDMVGAEPTLPRARRCRRHAGWKRRAPSRHRELPRARQRALGDELLLGSVPDALADEADRKLATFSMFVDREGRARRERPGPRDRRTHRRAGSCARLLERPLPQPDGLFDVGGGVEPRRRVRRQPREARARRAPRRQRVRRLPGAADPRALLPRLKPLLGTAGLFFAWSASKTYTHYGLRVGALIACIGDARKACAARWRRRSAIRAAAHGRTATTAVCRRSRASSPTSAMRAACDTEARRAESAAPRARRHLQPPSARQGPSLPAVRGASSSRSSPTTRPPKPQRCAPRASSWCRSKARSASRSAPSPKRTSPRLVDSLAKQCS